MSDTPHEPGGECRSCPVCLVLQVLRDVRPEVRNHLAAAGRELALALQAAMGPEREHGDPWASPSDMTPDDDSGRSPGRAPDGSAAHAPRRLRRIDIR
jgi:hypothetical protein